MPRIAGVLVLALLGLAPAAAQSLYATTPGAFMAVGTFGLQEHPRHDVALTGELGYRLGTGFDLGLGVRYAASETTELDYGAESSTWEFRPALGYHRPLGDHAGLEVRGLLNVGLFRQTSGGFGLGPQTVTATRLDADLSALVFGRVRLGQRLAVLPGAGLYHLRTLADRVDVVRPHSDGYWTGPAYDVAVRSTGVQFALPVVLRLGERSLVLSPTVRYALSDTYQILERVADLSLRFNF